ncbi:hypothetical protein ACFTR5_20765 [Bacillus velezensis]
MDFSRAAAALSAEVIVLLCGLDGGARVIQSKLINVFIIRK